MGTPGRLLLHVNEKKIKVGEVKYVVYDESDQMFDNGFYDDCVYLLKRVSKDAQIIFSSATMTNSVNEFIETVIVEYELVHIGELIPKNIVQEKLYCDKLEKNDILLTFLGSQKYKRAMIFCNTKIKSHNISRFLQENKFKAKPLNGDLTQRERSTSLNLFKEGKTPILVTTDVAARGLHIPEVDIIINYDVPTRSEFYVHRIGRTGRVDTKGYSLTFVCNEDIDRFKRIEDIYELAVSDITKKKIK